MQRYFFLILFMLTNIVGLSQQPRLVLPIGHTQNINSSQFSPDGKKIITASNDGTVKLWETISGNLLFDFKNHAQAVNQASFSPDGKRVGTASNDRTAKILDIQSARIIADLSGHSEQVNSIEFSPDGSMVVTASDDGIAKIWDANTGKLLGDFKHDNSLVEFALFSPDAKKIFTTYKYGAISVWDIASKSLVYKLNSGGLSSSPSIFSPDGTKFITTAGEGEIRDIETGELLLALGEQKGYLNSAVFCSDGKKVLTASDETVKVWNAVDGKSIIEINEYGFAVSSPDGNLILTYGSFSTNPKVWNAVTGELINTIQAPENTGAGMFGNFSPDGKKILITKSNGSEIWDVSTRLPMAKLTRHSHTVTSLQFSPDEKLFLTLSGESQTVYVWNTMTGALITGLQIYARIYSASFSPDQSKIVTTSSDRKTRIFEVGTGKLLTIINDDPNDLVSASFSSNGKEIITVYSDSSLNAWDATSGIFFRTTRKVKGTKGFQFFILSPDGKKMIINKREDNLVEVQNAGTGEVLFRLGEYPKHEYAASFSPDGKKILINVYRKKTVEIFDATNGKFLAIVKGETRIGGSFLFSPSGEKILTKIGDSQRMVYNAENGKLLLALPENLDYSGSLFSRDGKSIITSCYDNTIRVWDSENGTLLHTLKQGGNVLEMQPGPDGNLIISSSYDNNVYVWQITNGKLLYKLSGHDSPVLFTSMDKKGDFLWTISGDNTMKMWDMKNGKLIHSFFALDSNDYFSQIPSGFYQSSSSAAKLLHYVTKDLKVITFEQLDVKYNRPDKVLEAIGNTDTALIKSYRKAREKRIKKLGIDTTAFREGYSVPECDFVNRDSIAYEQMNSIVRLRIVGVDSSYKLDRFNIWVNETPLFGQRGISIRSTNSNSFDTTLTIKLSQGENRIETSITNVNGTESYRMPLQVNYSLANPVKESLRFIGIGIDQFADNKYNLQYSRKDIRDLSAKLKEKYGSDIIIDTLFNENVTISNVKALKQKLQQTNENDKVIIAYSGHGMLTKDYDYYLSTYAVNFDKPEENGLPYDELENLLDSIPARKKLMLIDACHSGEVDKEDLITLNSSSDSLIKGFKPVAYKKEGQLGLKNSFELMQSLFVNVGKSTGATIISAAAGTQFALERNDLKNGVFTYSILEAMNKYPTLKISELKTIVGKRVEELTKGLQKPTSRNETIAVDWRLW